MKRPTLAAPSTPVGERKVGRGVVTKRGSNSSPSIVAGFRSIVVGMAPFAWRKHALVLAAELQRARIDRSEARRLLIEAREMLHVPEAVASADQWERDRRQWRDRADRWLS